MSRDVASSPKRSCRKVSWALATIALAASCHRARAEEGASSPASGQDAFYVVSTSVEHQNPFVRSLRLAITGREQIEGKAYVWWEMTAAQRDGGHYAVRMLTERVPMTSPRGIGVVQRYLYRDAAGKVVEYRDQAGGKALLPVLHFERDFLPRPSHDAAYAGGFASAGAFLGHVIVRVPCQDQPERAGFDNPMVLPLRTDLLVGTQTSTRAVEAAKTDPDKRRAYTREEYDRMISAGMNYFGFEGTDPAGIVYRPVFFRTAPSFPDSFYRSNYWPAQMFLDEPSVRLGWSGGIPANPTGPEQVAEALRQRVASQYRLTDRRIKTGNGNELGMLDPYEPRAASWDTDYWSAWYQFAAGAPAVVHEGRYVRRGYGWEPEELFGAEGLDGLTFRDQVNCLNAFLRGGARAFDADWGVSVYPEGDPELREPALIQAYDMGARHIWFWTYEPNMTFDIEHRLIRAVCDHMARHPRGDLRAVNRAARVGIVLPPGYVFSWNGTWGMRREQLSPGGASYGDISAAAMWEAILCSRRGIPFDFLVDDPIIRGLGYERLVFVRRDGSLDVQPPWPQPRPAGRLALSLADAADANVADRMTGPSDYEIERATDITIDGDLSDWRNRRWIALRSESHGFAEMVDLNLTITNVSSDEDYRRYKHAYLGFRYDEATPQLADKHLLDVPDGKGCIVTEVRPDSPAARGGLQVGDLVVAAAGRKIDWPMHLFPTIEGLKNNYGVPIPISVRRSGKPQFEAPGNIAADVALAIDDASFYIAARVTDDVHRQPHCDWDYWKGDSIQIGFDPTLERRDTGYGENDHEIALVLKDGNAFAWRYHGRRGQPLGALRTVRTAIVRQGRQTLYEAAIPLAELAPMAPDLWPRAGFNIVVNDSDGPTGRKGRLELRRFAMTRGKKTKDFATAAFAPSPDRSKVSAGLLWRRRATREGGGFRLLLAVRSPAASESRARVRLQSLDSSETLPADAEISLPPAASARQFSLDAVTSSPPGRYRMEVCIAGPADRADTTDSLPVYIYPP